MRYSGDLDKLDRTLRNLPAILSGRIPDPTGVVQNLRLRMAMQLLSKIQQAFLVKSRGGTGEDGIQWQPLSPATIASRRVGRKDRKSLTWKARTGRLTREQREAFNKDYRQRLSKMVTNGIPREQASRLARAQAAQAARRKGADIPTRQSILASRDVAILIDTGELFRSFSPAIGGAKDGQIVEFTPNTISVGTNKKPWHHHGTSRLPARPYWPPNGDLPDSWWADIHTILQDGAKEILRRLR